ncbi:hypothetical protein [Curtobacterium sp. VKM Ac-2922]|uniref:hypothetical protein n=1 Tax=Curtobacterium sp. VKM Ac-2922 TaxID=2929475 RepID=UPI001FB55482|nr:hypothetical protein [Curtobacterium sp. VKM Ac-2922]MCJ1715663.1 hypothetical protein [Curtobacterium sp. VKM Ac-2922]
MSNLEVTITNGPARGRFRRRGGKGAPAGEPVPSTSPVPEVLERPTRSKRVPVQALGGEPRVDLLPAEVHVERRARAVARRAWLAVVVVGAVVVLVTGLATADGLRARSDLAQAQTAGASVLQQQLQYSGVRTVQRESDLIQAAQAVGGSAQIDWASVLGAVDTALPTGTDVTGLTVSSMDPVKGFTQSVEPLAATRVATVDITIASPTVPSVPDLADRLKDVPGYVDATISTVSSEGQGATYAGQISLELGPAAFDKTYEYKAAN